MATGSDAEVLEGAVGSAYCAHEGDLQVASTWDPGSTQSGGPHTKPRSVTVPSGTVLSPATGDPTLDKRVEETGMAKKRLETLMTLIHEGVHTTTHPRFGALMNDPQQVALREVGREGVTELLAKPVKQAVLNDLNTDESLRISLLGSDRYSPPNQPAAKYAGQVKQAEALTKTLGRKGAGMESLRLAFFRGWTEYIGFGDRSLAPFKGKKFATEELRNYMDARREGAAPEPGLHGDDRGRGVVDQWRRGFEPSTGTSPFKLDSSDKALLVEQMLRGATLNADERAILTVLENSEPAELRMMFAKTVSRSKLVRKFQGKERRRLAALIKQVFGVSLHEFTEAAEAQ